MNFQSFTVFSAVAMLALGGCVIVGNGGTGGGGGSAGGIGVGGNGGEAGGTGGSAGGIGVGGGGGGGMVACDEMLKCADATTDGLNPNNALPCDATSAKYVLEYAACACKQPMCSAFALCAKDAKSGQDYTFSAPLSGASTDCQTEVSTNCAAEQTTCSNDF